MPKTMCEQAMIQDTDIDKLCTFFSKFRFSPYPEERLQREVEEALTAHGYIFGREVNLTDEARIDFVVEHVGVEAKVKGSPIQIFRQVEKYCEAPLIEGIILITSKTMALPTLIKGKPARVIRIGEAWL